MNTHIDIQNNPGVLAFMVFKFTRLGWKIDPNIEINIKSQHLAWQSYPNKTAKFFLIDYERKKFSWFCEDDCQFYANITDKVESVDEAIELLKFIEENAELFAEVPVQTQLEDTLLDEKSNTAHYNGWNSLLYGYQDSLDYFIPNPKFKDEYDATAAAVHQLKEIAKTTNTPIITATQHPVKMSSWAEKINDDMVHKMYKQVQEMMTENIKKHFYEKFHDHYYSNSYIKLK